MGSNNPISDQVLVNGHNTTLTLDVAGNLRWTEGGWERCLSLREFMLGFVADGRKIIVKIVAGAGDGICCLGSSGEKFVRKQFVFEPSSDEWRQIWCRKLDQLVDSLERPKRLFIFVNPFGGKKSALKIFLDEVKPLLEDANIEFTVQETKQQLHAKEVVGFLDLSKYDGIVCVSGDGILVEVVNGLLEREDWETATKMPIGVIPAGTGNGMIKSLLDDVGFSFSAFNATLAVIRGFKRSLDVATISQGETRFFSVLMLAWGLVADIDIESEKYRWMGSARIDFYGVQRALSLRKYNGRVFFDPAPGFETFGEPCIQQGIAADEADNVKPQVRGYHGRANCLESMEWRSISGPFISIWLHNVPWGAENAMPAPNAKFSDGYLDLIVIRDCPKLTLLSLLTQLGDGSHVKSPYVMYLKVKAFVLEPGARAEDPTMGGIIDVDGEVLARGKGTYKFGQKTLMTYDRIRVAVDKGLATLFTPLPVLEN